MRSTNDINLLEVRGSCPNESLQARVHPLQERGFHSDSQICRDVLGRPHFRYCSDKPQDVRVWLSEIMICRYVIGIYQENTLSENLSVEVVGIYRDSSEKYKNLIKKNKFEIMKMQIKIIILKLSNIH